MAEQFKAGDRVKVKNGRGWSKGEVQEVTEDRVTIKLDTGHVVKRKVNLLEREKKSA